ncbi:MAG: gliding motility-associated C-terminal domain-containing protein, partial [Bacteroidota bacterium]|nr:gliding motility-associated C-terminal domain-containing protein [Bacteroidota bacterium]
AAPTASVTQQPGCAVSTGTITVSSPAPATGISYSINGTDYTNTTGVFSGLVPNTYNVTVKNSGGCVSAPLSLTVNTVPSAPAAPTASVTQQPGCAVATGTITVASPAPATGITYSINGTDYTNTTGIFTGLVPNTYNVTVKTGTGCVSAPLSLKVDAVSATLSATAAAADITCGQSTGTITINVTGGTAPYNYSLDGATAVGINIFPGVSAGSHKVTVKDAAGCSIDANVTIKQIACIPILEPKVFVPTAFTPNNNNKNDYLQPYLLNIRELTYFKVYNRWGQLVFQTNAIGKGWDGNLKGIQQPVETYTWILACIDIEGKVIKQSGRSVLIR